MDEKKPHALFVPFPAQSHVKCMLKLAWLLHHKGIQITFVNIQSIHNRLDPVGASGFQFKTVPDDFPSSDSVTPNPAILFRYLATDFLGSLLDVAAGLETPVTCIVSDALFRLMKINDVAERLKVANITFWTFAACGFLNIYRAKVMKAKGILPLKDESCLTNGYLDMEIEWIPGMENFRLRDLPRNFLAIKRDGHQQEIIGEDDRMDDNSSHMIIHTFYELEDTLVTKLRTIFPRIYTVGPLQLHLNHMENLSFNGYSLLKEDPECVQWLQSKEPNSVLYINFGSETVISFQELLEFGWGLVNSNHYFLWIIRVDLVDGKPTVLPQELEEAIKKRGFIASWCSQEEVLNHPSIGGFLTHGGWGSVIESLSAGVPMICFPGSHDQPINCKSVCEKWEVGMEVKSPLKRGEVEELVNALMSGIEGERMRKKAMEWKRMSEIATRNDGSSCSSIQKLVDEITLMSRK